MPIERRDILSSLPAKGFELQTAGRDHDFLFFRCAGLLRAVYTKVSRGTGHRVISDNLVSRMSRQLHLKAEEFRDLVACPLDQAEYETILRDRGVID